MHNEDLAQTQVGLEALREPEELQGFILDHLPVGILLADLAGTTHYVNSTFTELFGYTLPQVPTLAAWWPLVHPEPTYRDQVVAEWDGRLAEALAEGSEFRSLQLMITCSDGAEKDVRVMAKAIGNLLFVTFVDLTERQAAEDATDINTEQCRMLLMLAPDGVSVSDYTGRILACNEQFAALHGFDRAADVIGRHAQELARPEAFAELYRKVAEALAQGKAAVRDIEVEVLRRDGSPFPSEYSVAPVPWPDAPFGVAYVANIRDVTKRKELIAELERHRIRLEELVQERTAELTAAAAEAQRLNEQLEQRLALEQAMLETLEKRVADRTRELSTLYRVSAIAAEALPLDSAMARSLGVVLATLGGQMGVVHLRVDDESPLRLAAQQGFAPEAAAELEAPPSAGGWWHQVLARDRPLMLLNAQPAPDWANIAWPPAMAGEARACLAVPIRVQGWPAGVLSVLREDGQAFMAEEMALLTTIADQLGTAVESDRLRRSAEQARLLAERQRLARDLHDAVSQSLYSLALFADAAREMGKTGQDERVSHYLERIEQTAHQALKEMRLLIYELRPSALEHGGLRGALERRLEAVERRAGIDAALVASNSVATLPRPVEDALYHIAQEALNNVLKHARAAAVTVRLTAGDGWVELAVMDDGVGFDPQMAAEGGGLGLNNIRHRVEQVGGSLILTSAPGQGTEVRVRILTPEVG